jgi:diphosphomevalonate decarboxylase
MNNASAIAHPNIAFVKYWGNFDVELNLPANGSISMNLGELTTTTSVEFNPNLTEDIFVLNGKQEAGESLTRVSRFLDQVRELAHQKIFARVTSENNFPIGAGIASSASGFAALAKAASTALGLHLDDRALSRLARRGSGSAARSIPPGFVELFAGKTDQEAFAETIAPPGYWSLHDIIAVVECGAKPVGSSLGHILADSSPVQPVRVASAPERLERCRKAIREREFASLAEVVELDSNLMHAAMMTSQPPLLYWVPETIGLMKKITGWRKEGLQACYTIDAGPNVHVICTPESAEEVEGLVAKQPAILQVLHSVPGGGASTIQGFSGS